MSVKKTIRHSLERTHRVAVDVIYDFALILRDGSVSFSIFFLPGIFLVYLTSHTHTYGHIPVIYLAQREERASYRRIKPSCERINCPRRGINRKNEASMRAVYYALSPIKQRKNVRRDSRTIRSRSLIAPVCALKRQSLNYNMAEPRARLTNARRGA